jgi:hypothetical protein
MDIGGRDTPYLEAVVDCARDELGRTHLLAIRPAVDAA